MSKKTNVKKPAGLAAASGSGHVCHYLRIGTMKPLTFGEIKRQLEIMSVPDTATFRAVNGNKFDGVTCLSFCRSTGEISVW